MFRLVYRIGRFMLTTFLLMKAMEEMSDEQLAGLEGVTSDFAAPLLYSMQLALKNQIIDKKVIRKVASLISLIDESYCISSTIPL